jgi:hypothetical protein
LESETHVEEVREGFPRRRRALGGSPTHPRARQSPETQVLEREAVARLVRGERKTKWRERQWFRGLSGSLLELTIYTSSFTPLLIVWYF